MPSRSSLCAALSLGALALAARPSTACGPDFPIELLADRGPALAELPEGIFVDEAARLVPAAERYRDPCPADADADAGAEDGESDDASARAATVAEAKRACAAARGVAPPGLFEAALYRAGAAAFHAGRTDEAAAWFTTLLALPGPLRVQLSTSAAYSLGRLHVDDGGRGSYRRVRTLVDAGFVDPDGLAAASLRNQAVLTDDPDDELALLAARAALGYDDSQRALLSRARAAIADGAVDRLLATAIGQRLLAAYLYSRDHELTDDQRTAVWAAIARAPRVAGADRLAAAAYRAGAWDRAATLAARADDTAVNRWVRAKLAARAGDVAGAADLACSAAEELPTATACAGFSCGDYLARDRALAECAMLELAADRPTSAMRHAWQARGRYRDVLYIADRVLSTAELRAFLDELAAAPADRADDHGLLSQDALEALYARRLIREGQLALGAAHLPAADRPAALAYAEHLALAEVAPDRLVRAEALFRASLLARAAGMELAGTGHAPDWAIVDGEFDLATYTYGPDSLVSTYSRPWDDDGEPIPPAPPSTWVSADERRRVAASAPSDPRRFHYRHRAAELARAAAELVPPYAAAHRALHCWADTYPDGRGEAYLAGLRAHVLAGAPLPDAACAEPNFAQARHARPPRHQPRHRDLWDRYPRWTARLRAAAPFAAIAVLALCLAGAVALARRRQRRHAAVP
jgi:hypothetical protein